MFWENSLVVKDYSKKNIDDKKPQSMVAVLLGLWLCFYIFIGINIFSSSFGSIFFSPPPYSRPS